MCMDTLTGGEKRFLYSDFSSKKIDALEINVRVRTGVSRTYKMSKTSSDNRKGNTIYFP